MHVSTILKTSKIVEGLKKVLETLHKSDEKALHLNFYLLNIWSAIVLLIEMSNP